MCYFIIDEIMNRSVTTAVVRQDTSSRSTVNHLPAANTTVSGVIISYSK